MLVILLELFIPCY